MANNKMLEELDTQIENLKKQREAVVAKGGFGNSPAPGEKAVFT